MNTKLFHVIVIVLSLKNATFAQTYVSGGIYSNAIWTIANSPYIVTDTLTLFPGVTLTIDPGVQVRFDHNVPFEVRGSLIALGTAADSITFMSNMPIPNQQSWPGIHLHTILNAQLNFSYCRLFHAYTAVYLYFASTPLPSSITNSLFQNNHSGIQGYAAQNFLSLTKCTFNANTYGIGAIGTATAHLTPDHCLFINNTMGISYTEDVDPVRSTFCGNNRAIAVRYGDIDSCIIMNNVVGLDQIYDNGLYQVTNSTIALNDTGIILHSGSTSLDFFANVNICLNNNYNVVHSGIYNFSMDNLCWCDTDSFSISQKIYDGFDNILYGLIDFMPAVICDNSALPDVAACAMPTMIATDKNLPQFKLYPNPFDDYTVLESSIELENAGIMISNLTGQIVAQFNYPVSERFVIKEKLMIPGFYILTISENNKILFSTKLIVL